MTTPQMDWLDDERRKRAVSSDDVVERLRTVVAVPHGVDIWTTTALEAADEIERLRADLAAWQATVRSHDALAAETADEIQRLRTERDGWQATAAGLSQDVSNADDEIERLRAAGDAIADALVSWINGKGGKTDDERLCEWWVRAWWEARRG